ncbi:hypothetical protein QQ045_009108 [Rhodiola kirilowii]
MIFSVLFHREANQKEENKNKGQMQNASTQTDAKKNQEVNRGDASDTLWSTETSRADAPPATQVAQLVHLPLRENLFTVFIDNIPEDKDSRWLRNLFSRDGKVMDVYIPSKLRRASKSRYGFVRYKSMEEAVAAINRWNTFKVGNYELGVKLAYNQGKPSGKERRFLLKGDEQGREATKEWRFLLKSGDERRFLLKGDEQGREPTKEWRPRKREDAESAKRRVILTPVQSHCVENRVTPNTTFLKFGEFPIDVDLTKIASTSGGRKDMDVAPIADDPDTINEAKEVVTKGKYVHFLLY